MVILRKWCFLQSQHGRFRRQRGSQTGIMFYWHVTIKSVLLTQKEWNSQVSEWQEQFVAKILFCALFPTKVEARNLVWFKSWLKTCILFTTWKWLEVKSVAHQNTQRFFGSFFTSAQADWSPSLSATIESGEASGQSTKEHYSPWNIL